MTTEPTLKKKLPSDVFRRFNSLRDQYWCIPEEVGLYLKNLVLEKNVKTAFEIGTSIGCSSLWLAMGLRKTGGKLYTLESHTERFALAQSNFKKSGLSEYIVQIKGHAPEIFKTLTLPTKIDLAFVDGVKKSTTAYVKALLPFMNGRGVIVVDNIASHREEMAPFIDWLNKSEYKFELKLKLGEGLAIINL